MGSLSAFNSLVAARTRTADQILGSAELRAAYLALGGLDEDLEAIRRAGLQAEALNHDQSGAMAAGGAATQGLLDRFAELQREYKAVMAVVQAVEYDLELSGAPAELIAALQKIQVNEAEVHLVAAGDDPQKKKKRAVRSTGQEPLRAEIEKDAAALVALKPAHAALARRRVDKKRLERLGQAARSLAGKLGERAAKKGAAKSATRAEQAAVAEQSRAWSACYRLLAALGRKDERVRLLLRDAAGK